MISGWADSPGAVDPLPGREMSGPRGLYWLHTQRIHPRDPFPPWPLPRPLGRHPGEDAALDAMALCGWEGVVFLDLETCGFAGTPLFLAGMLFWQRGAAVLEQVLARTYAEEAAVVEAVVDRLGDRPVVSFNGKSYDIPFLTERAGRHGIRHPKPSAHLDLLHAARRRWRHSLPDCRLTTLESAIHGAARTGDVPGRDVPERYHAFVRSGEPRLLLPVLRHNRRDLLTLLGLVARLERRDLRERSLPGARNEDRVVLGLTSFFA